MNHTITALGWTLVHFLWQGAGIAALLAGARWALRKRSAEARYAAAMAAMLLMLASAATTFIYLQPGDIAGPRAAAAPGPAPAQAAPTIAPSSANSWSGRVPDYLPALVYIWIAGVMALSVRSLGGWVVTQQWKRRNIQPVETYWQERMERLRKQLAISRKIRLWKSVVADTPAVIGWIRPVVLLPASALSGLAPFQIEALLAHELAHIRRHDYLINLLQTGVETLLFYHPAVWWVGRQMRTERENCCDDLAVAVCGDAVVYARALTELERIRMATPRLAMAANSGSLLERVQRLLEKQRAPGRLASFSTDNPDWLTGIAIALCVVSIWATSHVPARRAAVTPAQSVHLVSALYQENREPLPVQHRQLRTKLVALAGSTEENEQEAQAPSATPSTTGEKTFLGGLTELGYKDLTVDQLIALKIHGVTTEYVRDLLAAGLKLKVDQLVNFAIHGAEPADIVEMQKLGYKLGPDEIVNMQIHGLTPEYTRQMKAAGLGTPTFDQLISFMIHGVTPEIAAQFKQAGVRDLSFDKLVALQIHGASPDEVKQIGKLGYANLSADDVVNMCIHGVDADFVRKAQGHGFKDLSLDKLIQLKQFGILD